MIPITHTECGETAFLYAHAPFPHSKMDSKLAQKPNGDPIPVGTTICCYSCDKRITDPRHLTWEGKPRSKNGNGKT